MTIENTKEELLEMAHRHLKSYQQQIMAVQSWKMAYEKMEQNFDTSQVVIHRLENEVKKLSHPHV